MKGNTIGWKMTFRKSKLIDNRLSLALNFHGKVETWCSYCQIPCSVGDCWTHSEKKTSRGRKSLSPSVWDNCCLCVKFGSQGIIFELRTSFSPQSRRAHLMWFSRSCMSESDGLPIEYCEPRIGRTEFQAVVTFLICGTIMVTVFTLCSVPGFWGGKENLWEIIASSPFSPPPPTFASPLACLSCVYFSQYPQMESLLAGYCLDWLIDKLADHLLTS